MKITAQVLAEKIAGYLFDEHSRAVSPNEVLAAVPELAGFDLMADEIQRNYQAAQVALADAPSDPELIQLCQDYAKTYENAVGEAPAEPVWDSTTGLMTDAVPTDLEDVQA